MSMPPANPYENRSVPTTGNIYTGGQRSIKRLKRIEPLSLAKIQGTVLAVMGLIPAVMFALIASVGAGGGGMQGPGNQMAAGLVGGLIMAIFVPIVYGVIGFIGGLIMALIYNFCASVMGGIEFEFDE